MGTQELELPRFPASRISTPKPPKQVAVAFPVPSLTWAKATKKGRTSDARLSAGLRQPFNPNQCHFVCMSTCLFRFLSLQYHPNIHDMKQHQANTMSVSARTHTKREGHSSNSKASKTVYDSVIPLQCQTQ